MTDIDADFVIHCGGCYLSPQQMQARVRAFRARGIPVINYGTFLSYAAGGLDECQKVLNVWQ